MTITHNHLLGTERDHGDQHVARGLALGDPFDLNDDEWLATVVRTLRKTARTSLDDSLADMRGPLADHVDPGFVPTDVLASFSDDDATLATTFEVVR